MSTVEITGTTFVREMGSKALVNRDSAGLDDYHKKRKLMELQRQEINNLKEETQSIKQELGEIKQLMLKLLEK